jgi:hypothetical protein
MEEKSACRMQEGGRESFFALTTDKPSPTSQSDHHPNRQQLLLALSIKLQASIIILKNQIDRVGE